MEKVIGMKDKVYSGIGGRRGLEFVGDRRGEVRKDKIHDMLE